MFFPFYSNFEYVVKFVKLHVEFAGYVDSCVF